jgi:hypothetical protein
MHTVVLGTVTLVLVLAPDSAPGQDAGAACQERLGALALMQTLNARILSSRSATASLEDWCAARGLASEPKVTARLVTGVAKVPTREQLDRLQVAEAEAVRYRRVQLACGDRVLSEADNWYVPGRLTPEMNRLLDTTDTPFGRAVQPLRPHRQTLAVTVLWQAMPEGWERRPLEALCDVATAPLALPEHLFEHRAILYASDGRPFSEVSERYTREVLAPPGSN